MNSGKIVADGTGRDGWRIEGSTRGPRGPKNVYFTGLVTKSIVRSTTVDAALVLLLLSASGIAISMTRQLQDKNVLFLVTLHCRLRLIESGY